MVSEKNTIIFRLSYNGFTNLVQTRKDQYESLMCLISEYIRISRFGVCYGGGTCKTCGVIMNEEGGSRRKFVLSCEVKIDDELAGKSIMIL